MCLHIHIANAVVDSFLKQPLELVDNLAVVIFDSLEQFLMIGNGISLMNSSHQEHQHLQCHCTYAKVSGSHIFLAKLPQLGSTCSQYELARLGVVESHQLRKLG